MRRSTSGSGDTLSQWLEVEDIVPPSGPGAIADVAQVRALLIAAAERGEAVSYSGLLGQLGYRFTRPRMRALCRTLDAIDDGARAAEEPAMAVLVVRESDRLPGQGWWVAARERGYGGSWSGEDARRYVAELQQRAFDYWHWTAG